MNGKKLDFWPLSHKEFKRYCTTFSIFFHKTHCRVKTLRFLNLQVSANYAIIPTSMLMPRFLLTGRLLNKNTTSYSSRWSWKTCYPYPFMCNQVIIFYRIQTDPIPSTNDVNLSVHIGCSGIRSGSMHWFYACPFISTHIVYFASSQSIVTIVSTKHKYLVINVYWAREWSSIGHGSDISCWPSVSINHYTIDIISWTPKHSASINAKHF